MRVGVPRGAPSSERTALCRGRDGLDCSRLASVIASVILLSSVSLDAWKNLNWVGSASRPLSRRHPYRIRTDPRGGSLLGVRGCISGARFYQRRGSTKTRCTEVDTGNNHTKGDGNIDFDFEPDEFSEYVRATAKDVDPFGYDFGQEFNQRTDDPDAKFYETGDPSDHLAYGPEAVLLAGFAPDEIAMVRILLDKAGGQAVKVVPVNEAMLSSSVDAALQVEEPDLIFIKQNCPELLESSWTQRAIIFGGMPWSAQAALIELLDSNWKGTTPFIVQFPATIMNKDETLEEALAEATDMQVKAGLDAIDSMQDLTEEVSRFRSWRKDASEVIAEAESENILLAGMEAEERMKSESEIESEAGFEPEFRRRMNESQLKDIPEDF